LQRLLFASDTILVKGMKGLAWQEKYQESVSKILLEGGVVDEKGNRNTINNVKNRKGEFYGKF